MYYGMKQKPLKKKLKKVFEDLKKKKKRELKKIKKNEEETEHG